ncbi:MAG: tyrosine--tRNA ligase [Chloroflexi bacterium RBG_16_58_8]|nr:MAG: tyrosine--tRNA ligase [Chloroflexi bacterium RBG_16_58_8]
MDTANKSNNKNVNNLLKRAVAEIIVEDELVRMLKSGQKLRLKFGLDPSAPDLHLGHTVVFRKLRQFQELGHQVILIVGDWTAQIGDPSGVSLTRKMLTAEQVRENADTYMKQFFMVVDKEKTEIKWQSEWFGKFDLADVVRLTSKFTVAQFLAREDFNKRFNEGKPIAITELLYPLLQAYDSVAMEADVEFGGTDQKFNLLVGRELQAMMGQKPQQVFMTPLLVGTDGVLKMSKSVGNYIGVAEPPEDIFGKTMSIRDDFILPYFELLTDVPDKELAEFRAELGSGANPMDLKKRLAREIIVQLYSRDDAIEAEKHFQRVVQKKEVPDEIQEFEISAEIALSRLLVDAGLAASRSEATRLISQGACTVDGIKVTDANQVVGKNTVIKVGKRRFLKCV